MRILNSNELIPVSASYAGDEKINFKGDNERIITNDGYSYFKTTVMNSLVDVKGNKYSFFGLTDSKNVTDLLTDTLKRIETVGPVGISHDNTLLGMIGASSTYDLIRVDITSPDALLFTFNYEETISGDYYYSMMYRETAITIDPNDPNQIIYSTFIGGNNQIFKLIPTDAGQSLWLQSKDGDYAIAFGGNKYFHLKSSQGEVVDSRYLYSNFDGYNTTNTWVRYENFYAPEYSTVPSNLTVDVSGSIPDVRTNFILNAPFEGISINEDSATIPFDIIPTKNFKTISSELSLIPTSGVSGADLVDFRNYNRIFTGGNQVEGYSNINLGYDSDYSSILTFKSDVFTYFHVPRTATEGSIQEAGLEFSGAFAGILPEFSDRIYKRLAGYEDMIWWGGGSHNGVQDGTWLCAWLSGGEGDTSVWVERYYDPGKIEADDAITSPSEGVVTNINFTPSTSPVQDVVSTMTLDPGAYYKYYHIGSGGFKKLLETQKGVTPNTRVVQLSDFTLGNVVNDESQNNNDGTIYNYDNADIVSLDIGFGTEDQSAVLLNGNSEIRVNSSPTFNVEIDKSITSWIYSRDWTAGRSTTLFTNYYNGGDKFEFINHGLYYSYMIPTIVNGDTKFTLIPSEISTSGDLIIIDGGEFTATPVSVGVDSDGYPWVAAISTFVFEGVPYDRTTLFKLTPSGKILESITIDGFKAFQVLIKDENVLLLIADNGNEVKTFNLHTGLEINSYNETGGHFRYIGMGGELSGSPSTRDMDLFTDGTICRIGTDGKFYLGAQIIGTAPYTNETSQHICCDDELYYFITTVDLYNNLTLRKIRKDDSSDVQTFIATGGVEALNISFISKEAVDGVVRTIIYWIGHDFIKRYYIDGDGVMTELSTIETENFERSLYGDFSGYKMNKRTYFNTNDSKPYVKYSVILDNASDEPKQVITHSTEDFSDNWHYFAIIKNSDTSRITLYIDGEVEEYKTGIADSILYLTGSMLNIGGASDGSDPLFEQLGLVDRNIDGGVSAFTIFNIALDDDDVRSLYISKFTSNNSMEWVIDNGKKDFVEELQNVFKFKKPGTKSQFFNVVIRNINLTDTEKVAYETYIRSEIGALLPANLKLVKVVWR